jgi:hypothetical protein
MTRVLPDAVHVLCPYLQDLIVCQPSCGEEALEVRERYELPDLLAYNCNCSCAGLARAVDQQQ